MKIFQYEDDQQEARWVAADTEVEANRAAFSRRWRPCGGQILVNRRLPTSLQGLVDMGCDVVVV